MKRLMLWAGVALVVSCQPAAEQGHENTLTHAEEEHHDPAHTPQNHVSLNNGQRWQANVETTEGIENMQVLIQNFDAESGSYDELQTNLQNEFRLIFKRCTMKGEAHDQLHNYLIPLKEKIVTVTPENIKDTHSYLKTYKDYFQ